MDSEVFSRIRDYLAEQLEVEPEKSHCRQRHRQRFSALTVWMLLI